MTQFKDFLKEQLKDDELRAEYETLGPVPLSDLAREVGQILEGRLSPDSIKLIVELVDYFVYKESLENKE